jgi:hypothetical protein
MTAVFVICTVQKSPRPNMSESFTWTGVLTPGPAVDRSDLLKFVMEQALPEQMRGGVVLFYSAEPLRFDGSAEPAQLAPAPATSGSES